jgi:diacylglycerol kinase (ATP)
MPLHLSRKLKTIFRRPVRAKLIYNPGSGQAGESPKQLVEILSQMQARHILPEVYIVHPGSRLEHVVRRAIRSGIRLIVVAGGDGTIEGVVGAMIGTDATLGIIPTGTRNNVAFNLGIPGNIAKSVALLRRGRRMKIDAGRVHSGRSRHWFLEAAALGLLSDVYPMADDIGHGSLAKLGELFSKFVSATPSRLRVTLDGRTRPESSAHMMVVANMSYLGPHFRISPNVSFLDGCLDVFTFSDMSKLNMISYAVLSRGGLDKDAGILHYRAKRVRIISKPRMPVISDGILMGRGSLSVHIHPRALAVMAGKKLTGGRAAMAVKKTKRTDDG